MAEANSWAGELAADSEDALQRLCEAIAAGLEDPNPIPADPAPRGNRPLGGPAAEAAAQPNIAVIDGIKALMTAITGAADLASQRMRVIGGTVTDEAGSRSSGASDDGVLIQLGRAALERILGDGRH